MVTFLFIDHPLTNYKFLMYWIEVTDFDHRGLVKISLKDGRLKSKVANLRKQEKKLRDPFN
jgi:hypothetical protein